LPITISLENQRPLEDLIITAEVGPVENFLEPKIYIGANKKANTIIQFTKVYRMSFS
jgi:hypothetical protein